MAIGSTDHIPVSQKVADLLNRVAVEWVPPRFADRNIEQFQWSDQDLSAQARRLRVNKHQLEILCFLPVMTIPEARASRDEIPFAGLREGLSGRTEDGLSFSASHGITVNLSQSIRASTVETQFLIRSFSWSIWNEARPAQLWVTPIELKSNDYATGNLLLSSDRGSSWTNFRLCGSSYIYYLLNLGSQKHRQLLAIDTQGALYPDPDLIWRELNYLSFSLGESIAADNLLGLEETGKLVGIVGGSFAGRVASRWGDSVVPMFEHRYYWTALLFRQLCRFHAAHDSSDLGEFTLGIWYLLSSYRESSGDIRRSKIFIGLTAIARFIENNHLELVDPIKWNSWLSIAHPTVDKIANQGAHGALLNQLSRSNVADNVSIVALALQRSDLELLPIIQSATIAATEGLRGRPLEIEHHALENDAVLRSVLVALVAKTIGYDGAIAGWRRLSGYFYWGRADATWWPVSAQSTDESRTTYIAKAVASPVAVKDLWPTFAVLTVPNAGPIGILVSFATALALKTDGSVGAKVVPVPREGDERPQLFDFVLYLITNPRTRSVLFTAYEKDGQTLVILDWDDTDLVVDINQELESLLSRIANSDETRIRIERLALAAEAEGD